mgnify:CR=1 FL=1
MNRLIGLVLCSLAATSTVGCGSLLQDRCDAVCDCENCGEREREACEVAVEGDYEVADIYQCTDQLEAYFECNLQEYSCENRQYSDDLERCNREFDDYEDCRRNTSARDRGPYGDPNF